MTRGLWCTARGNEEGLENFQQRDLSGGLVGWLYQWNWKEEGSQRVVD